jgi:misacylated tRNA(Ala) deacylase
MTYPLFRDDAYLRQSDGRVVSITETGGIVLDRSLFYATGGGQPGDGGVLEWDGGICRIETCVKGEGDDLVCIPAGGEHPPPAGAEVIQRLDWDRRHAHMRVHTALHLLSVAIPFGVTGGAIGAGKGRLDFDMAEPPEDRDAIEAAIIAMIASDAAVTAEWITEEELDARPDMVKTLSVQPPRGAGRIRVVRIGTGLDTIDLQPCGGTHVKSLAEIGAIRLGKIEKKGRMNRRVNLFLVEEQGFLPGA